MCGGTGQSGGAAACLDFEEDLDEGAGGGGDAGDAAGLAEGEGADAVEFFDHLAGEAGAGAVVEPVRNGAGFVVAETLHGALLLGEVAGEFDSGFDGLQLVADPGGEGVGCLVGYGGEGGEPDSEGWRGEAGEERGEEVLDGDGGALEELGKEVAAGGLGVGDTARG